MFRQASYGSLFWNIACAMMKSTKADSFVKHNGFERFSQSVAGSLMQNALSKLVRFLYCFGPCVGSVFESILDQISTDFGIFFGVGERILELLAEVVCEARVLSWILEFWGGGWEPKLSLAPQGGIEWRERRLCSSCFKQLNSVFKTRLGTLRAGGSGLGPPPPPTTQIPPNFTKSDDY